MRAPAAIRCSRIAPLLAPTLVLLGIAVPAAHAAGPVFVQQVSKRAAAASVGVQLPGNVAAGDRLVVEAGVWSAGGATASSVTDSAGNTYTKLTSLKASDSTELSVWSAPLTAGGGSRPTVTVKASGSADVGVALVEYAGLSSAAGTGAVDQLRTATGTTGTGAAAVSSGATAASTAGNELAIGFYADSGFGDALTGDPAYATRVNLSPTSDMEYLVQDHVLAASGTTAAPTTSTGAKTPWLAATVVLKGAAAPVQGAAQMASLASNPSAATMLLASTAAASPTRIYAFDTPRLRHVRLQDGRILLCPLSAVATGLTLG